MRHEFYQVSISTITDALQLVLLLTLITFAVSPAAAQTSEVQRIVHPQRIVQRPGGQDFRHWAAPR